MNFNKHLLLLISILFSINSFSQNQFLDYIVKQNNDTIYGTFRSLDNIAFFEKNIDPKHPKVKFRSHKMKKNKINKT